MQIRAAVLEATGGPLTLCDLDLAPPGPEEVLVRLGASGVCHSDWNAVDGIAATPCPAVLGHEGAGVVEAVGAGVTRVRVGPLPALTIPRNERRILGSIYGSSKRERDFPTTLALYRAGRLPLDRLVSHRLGLDEIERAFELMQSGDALRVVLDLSSNGRP